MGWVLHTLWTSQGRCRTSTQSWPSTQPDGSWEDHVHFTTVTAQNLRGDSLRKVIPTLAEQLNQVSMVVKPEQEEGFPQGGTVHQLPLPFA